MEVKMGLHCVCVCVCACVSPPLEIVRGGGPSGQLNASQLHNDGATRCKSRFDKSRHSD